MSVCGRACIVCIELCSTDKHISNCFGSKIPILMVSSVNQCMAKHTNGFEYVDNNNNIFGDVNKSVISTWNKISSIECPFVVRSIL